MSSPGPLALPAITRSPASVTLALAGCLSAATLEGDGPRARHEHAGDGIHAWMLADEGPALLDFVNDAGSLQVLCEPTTLRAWVDDDAGHSFTVRWAVFGPRDEDGGPGALEHVESASYASDGDPVEARLPYTCRGPGTYDVSLTITDQHDQSATYAVALHCMESAPGSCDDGAPPVPVGAVTCDPAFWVALDLACVAERLGPLPSCASLCPVGEP